MRLDEAIVFCKEKSQNIKLKAEPQTFVEIAEWLEELKQYRAIGTVEECREAVEKQREKKPDFEGDGYADGHLRI